jgi:RpiR family transcriptional regulator, carbohydrate utilization regulator
MGASSTARTTRRTKGLEANSRLPLLAYLKGILNSLNPTDRLIAETVLADPEKIITSPIAEIRKSSGASVGSIIGFCRRLGIDGYAAFKIALARELAQSGLSADNVTEDGSLLDKVFQFHERSLAETLKINSHQTFEAVTLALDRARHIEFFSIGVSYAVAYTAYCKFQLIGLSASTQLDSHIQLIAATQLKEGDLAFAISCSGNTRETVQCLEIAKARGATTVCLTNAMKSAITLHSDHCLYATPSEIKYFQAPLASRITQLAIIDALFVSLALKHKNRTAGRLQQSAQELLKRR